MKFFEFHVVTSAVRTDNGPYVLEERLTYAIPEEAEELFEPVLAPYDQTPIWYFDKINFGRPPAPWAIACFHREYAIAGHIATCRPEGAGIHFVPYTQPPVPLPNDFVPQVGAVLVGNKTGLEDAADKSPLFEKLWKALENRSPEQRWLLLLDPLPEDWLAQVLPGDTERWLSSRS